MRNKLNAGVTGCHSGATEITVARLIQPSPFCCISGCMVNDSIARAASYLKIRKKEKVWVPK